LSENSAESPFSTACLEGLRTVAKPELGTKRLCAGCAAKFYDLNKTPITCPTCGTIFEVIPPVTTRQRPDRSRAAHEPEAPEVEVAELISLEEADEEAQGKKAPVADGAEAAEVEDDAPDILIEEEEEEDTDVSEIIGGDIEDKEEI
jgi:uncharacterized protein (TIGR02300 family)